MTDQVWQYKITDGDNLGSATNPEFTEQWRVRTSLCLALNMGHSTIYREPKALKQWNDQEGVKANSREMSKIMPACTLRTTTLAREVIEMARFLGTDGTVKNVMSQIMVGAILKAAGTALNGYNMYTRGNECANGHNNGNGDANTNKRNGKGNASGDDSDNASSDATGLPRPKKKLD